MIGAQGSDEGSVAPAGDPGDRGAQSLGELDRVRADSSRRADDRHARSCRRTTDPYESAMSGKSSTRSSGCFFVRDVRRLRRECPLVDRDVFGVTTHAAKRGLHPENGVTRPEARRVGSCLHDDTRDVAPQNQGEAPHQVAKDITAFAQQPVARIHRRGMDFNEDLS